MTRPEPAERLPIAYRLAALTYARFEGDVIEEFVRHTLRFVDRLYIVDNRSPDATREILNALMAEGLPITIWQSDDPESRAGIVTRLARRVFAADAADYLLVLDPDEFLRAVSRETFEFALSRLPDGAHGAIPGMTYLPTAEDADAPGVLGNLRYRLAGEENRFSKMVVARSFAHEPAAEIGATAAVPLDGVAIARFPVRSIAQLQGTALLGWSAFLIREDGGDRALAERSRRLYVELNRGAEWTREDLSRFARAYLDVDRAQMELVFDPMPTYERRYDRPIPGVVELAISYTRSLTDYCLRLKLAHAVAEAVPAKLSA